MEKVFAKDVLSFLHDQIQGLELGCFLLLLRFDSSGHEVDNNKDLLGKRIFLVKLKYFFNETQCKLLMFSNAGCVDRPDYKDSILQGVVVAEGLVVFFY